MRARGREIYQEIDSKAEGKRIDRDGTNCDIQNIYPQGMKKTLGSDAMTGIMQFVFPGVHIQVTCVNIRKISVNNGE